MSVQTPYNQDMVGKGGNAFWTAVNHELCQLLQRGQLQVWDVCRTNVIDTIYHQYMAWWEGCRAHLRVGCH